MARPQIRLLVSAGLALTIAGATCAAESIAAVDEIVASFAREHRVPATSVVIMRGDRIAYARGHGIADHERNTPATADTVYQMGSIAKQFTVAAILRLAEQGKFSLEDRVAQLLPDFGAYGDGIRLRHLLQQTSGIREFFTIAAVNAAMSDVSRPHAELLDLIRREPTVFPPGERWSYSNSNYALLAVLLERMTGLPYDEFIAREFLRPLGLATIRHATPLPQQEREARGYVVVDDRLQPSPPENFNWARGDGGLCASATDLARWTRALTTGRVLQPPSFRRMTTADALNNGSVPDYGYGLSLVPLDREPRISHGGAMYGFSSTVAYYPARDVIIVVMTNLGRIWPQPLEQRIARLLFGLPEPEFRAVPIGDAELARFTGRFSLGDMFLNVERKQRVLHATMPHGPSYPLRFVGDGRFVAEPDVDAISLRFDAGNEPAQRVRLSMAGMTWYGERVP